MGSLSPHALRAIAQRHGVVTSEQLSGFGLTKRQIDYLVTAGQLARVRQGVFRHAAAPRTYEQRLAVACAVADVVMISHTCAGRLRGLRRLGRDRRVHVTIPGRAHLDVPDAVIHRSHLIVPSDVVERDDGIRLTSVSRTIFDLAAVVSEKALESIIEQALHDDLCELSSLQATVGLLCRQGRNGSERFRRVLEARPEWWKAVDSDLELRLEHALVAAGLPRPMRQHAITLPDGSVIHPDFYWPDPPTALEIDHSSWHGGREQQTYDKWRDRQLTRSGVKPMRVSEDDILQRVEMVVADVAGILHP